MGLTASGWPGPLRRHEQNHDADGMIFPFPLHPFEVVVAAASDPGNSGGGNSEMIYGEIQGQGLDVLIDDRDVRPGVKFKDAGSSGDPRTHQCRAAT